MISDFELTGFDDITQLVDAISEEGFFLSLALRYLLFKVSTPSSRGLYVPVVS